MRSVPSLVVAWTTAVKTLSIVQGALQVLVVLDTLAFPPVKLVCYLNFYFLHLCCTKSFAIFQNVNLALSVWAVSTTAAAPQKICVLISTGTAFLPITVRLIVLGRLVR